MISMKVKKIAVVLCSLLGTQYVAANCLTQFYGQTPPYLSKESLKQNSTPLCFNGFNVMYSGASKTPLWSAEYLTPSRLSQKIKREDNFHEEEQVSIKYRSTLKDYKASGYDRGHMAPNADMPDTASQFDSFSLANMVPQAPKNNQEVWRKLEEATRAMVTRQNQDAYVITGPIFSGKRLKTIGNGVLVPTATYKVVYLPRTGVIGAYYAPNDNSLKVRVTSVCEIEDLTGINLFPQLNESVKRKVYQLPTSTTGVKPNQKPELLASDTKSQCAEIVSDENITEVQKQFNANGASASAQVQGGWIEKLKYWLSVILEFILKMTKH